MIIMWKKARILEYIGCPLNYFKSKYEQRINYFVELRKTWKKNKFFWNGYLTLVMFLSNQKQSQNNWID